MIHRKRAPGRHAARVVRQPATQTLVSNVGRVHAFPDLRDCAHPVVFETGLADCPFSVKGTAFVVGFEGTLYLLTARHVVRDWPMEHLAIIISDAGERLPL